MSWKPGTAGGIYLKRHLFSVLRVSFNLMLVPVTGSIHLHYDEPRRYVLMFQLRRPRTGGDVVFLKGWPTMSWWRIHVYRADLVQHGVTQAFESHALFLSMEWAV